MFGYLFEMARSRQSAIDKIDDVIPQICSHVLKILVTKDDVEQNLNHWENELLNWFMQISRWSHLKGNRRLKLKDYQVEFANHFQKSTILASLVVMKYRYTILPFDISVLVRTLKDFCNSLFEAVSDKNEDKFTEFLKSDFINELYNKRKEVLLQERTNNE